MIAVAYGAGTNSTAMLIGMVERGEPVDVILFADTGGERPETYSFVETFSIWLVDRGYPPIDTVRSPNTTLEASLLKNKTLPSVAYGYKTCSQRFKIAPQTKALNEHPLAIETWAAGGKVTKLVGMDAGEPHRATPFEDGKFRNRYPLVEWDWDRVACLEAIERAGLPQPGKSSCFFCPNADEQEILLLKWTHPNLLARALALEANGLDKSHTIKGLGRRWSWADVVRQDAAQTGLFTNPPEMPCGCYDGGAA